MTQPIKESTYVKHITKFLNNVGFEAQQLQTPRSHSGGYTKKEPVDLFIMPGDWRIEVKRSHNDNNKFFYWKNMRNEQLLQLKELSEKGINCGILFCWNKDEYTFLHTSEISRFYGYKLYKEICVVLSLKEFAVLLRVEV